MQFPNQSIFFCVPSKSEAIIDGDITKDYLKDIKYEGRRNHKIYTWFCDVIVSCVKHRCGWLANAAKRPLDLMIPPQCEAAAMIFLENVWS